MKRLQKKREVADRSGAMTAHTSRQASNIRISAARTGRTSSSPARDIRRVQTKVTASSAPTKAAANGSPRANRSRPPGSRAATARKAPSARPSSRNGVRVYVVHQLNPISDPIRRASIAHNAIARLTVISIRGRRATTKTTSGQNK